MLSGQCSRPISAPVAAGTIVQLVSPSRFTQNDVLAICKPRGITLRLPRTLVFGLGWLSERMLAWLGRQSPFSVYRLKSALARLNFESDRARLLLGWTVQVDERQKMSSEASRV